MGGQQGQLVRVTWMCEDPKSCIFFLFLPNGKKMESSPKKRNKPIREEMRVGRCGEVIRGEEWAEGLD